MTLYVMSANVSLGLKCFHDTLVIYLIIYHIWEVYITSFYGHIYLFRKAATVSAPQSDLSYSPSKTSHSLCSSSFCPSCSPPTPAPLPSNSLLPHRSIQCTWMWRLSPCVVLQLQEGQLVLRHFQFLRWSPYRDVPDSKKAFLSLLAQVHNWQRECGEGRTIVHCLWVPVSREWMGYIAGCWSPVILISIN